MESLFAKYKAEREGVTVLETAEGFATYKFLKEPATIWLIDVFISKEKRRSGLGAAFVEQVGAIGRANGCTKLITSNDPRIANATEAVMAILACGFRISHVDGPLLLFKKEI